MNELYDMKTLSMYFANMIRKNILNEKQGKTYARHQRFFSRGWRSCEQKSPARSMISPVFMIQALGRSRPRFQFYAVSRSDPKTAALIYLQSFISGKCLSKFKIILEFEAAVNKGIS